jgi:hypothetical protein
VAWLSGTVTQSPGSPGDQRFMTCVDPDW